METTNLNKLKLKNPLSIVGEFFVTHPQIWTSFLIASGLMMLAYLFFGVYPVGERSVLSLDLNAQYVYYFAYMRDALLGSESILYSWSRNLSGENVGIIGYYLFSPFNLIVWIFPLQHITEGLLLMILTKIGFIGVTMSIYLTHRGFGKHTTVLFSVMYALCSYNIVQTMNPMWLDGVMALPLVVMGIESLMKQGKYKLLVFALVYSFVTCFYIGYMIAIFSALYFIYYALTSRRFTRDGVSAMAQGAGLFTVVAVVSVLISAFMLLPVYSALSLGKLEFAESLAVQAAKEEYTIENNFTLLEITRKLFPLSYDTVRMDGQPFLFSGTLALLTVPAYFFCDRIRRARRIGGIALLGILTISMYIVPLDMFWHGMQVPNWLPYRYSFMLCFLFIKFGAEAFENIKRIPHRVFGISAAAFAALLIYWEQADTFMSDLGSNGRDVFDWLKTIIPAMVVLFVVAAFVLLMKNRLNKVNLCSVALIFLVCLEMGGNAFISVHKQNEDIVYSSRKSFNSVMVPTRQVTNEINKKDKSLFRMEKTYIRSANDPMALRMNGVTHSSSMLNEQAIAILKSLGYSARSHASRYSGNTPLTDDLLGFKYILSCPDDNTGNINSKDDITYTVNDDVLPLAYLVYPKLLEFKFEGEKGKDGGKDINDDVFRNQSEMLSYMLNETGNEYFKQLEWTDRRPQNVTFEQMGDGYQGYTKAGEPIDSHIEYDFIAEQDGHVYFYFPTIYERKCNLWLKRGEEEPKFLGQVYETDHHHIQYIGHFVKGEKYMVTLSLTGDKMFFREEWIVRLDEDLLRADVARLHEINKRTEFRAMSNRHLRINTDYDKSMLLFTSIPNEPGWVARVNGQKVDIEDVGGGWETKWIDGEEVQVHTPGLMAVVVPAGSAVVDLKFFPNRMPLGLILTFVGIAVLVVMILIERFMIRVIGIDTAVVAKDDYDGFDSDYINIDNEFEDFDFDIAAKDEV